ncbi:unnamed protein product [Lepeophtheirus salmonis]|uniref:(salmon louse) hypothetical protein n=1 Tax=Lepeophtheirus salmonis TaxID=72036 RepID=A0A0K2SXJ7_LEPSM|nr:uncharacterized protein LOC121115431 [Lepeophtheirus salmonis]CAB4062240.1 unnamed protein product [Lepeophtheirus salmonis]CAF2899248.1 unnamed protein product [Lepeophtheirus salmonis]
MSIIESIREVKGTLSPYEKMKRSIIEKKLESEPFMKLCNCQRFSKYKTSSDCICMKDRSKDVDGEFERARIGFEANNAKLGIDKLTAAFLTFAENNKQTKDKDENNLESIELHNDQSSREQDIENVEEIIDETNFRNYV